MKQELSLTILERISKLREELESLPVNQAGRRRGISKDLRARILECQKQSQMNLNEFSQAIGISIPALGQWKQKEKQWNSSAAAEFRRVHVEESVVSENKLSEQFTLEGPRGIRVVGLKVRDIAELLRSL
jgi:transposase-like protein